MKQMSEDSEEEQSNSGYKPQNTPALTVQIEEKALAYIKKLCVESLKKYPTTLNVVFVFFKYIVINLLSFRKILRFSKAKVLALIRETACYCDQGKRK